MADEILTSTTVMGMNPPPLNPSVNEVEDTSGSPVDFNVCAASVIIISDDSLSTFLSTSAEMAILFDEDSIAVEADAVPGISWGADIFTEDVDDIMDGIEWGEEFNLEDIPEWNRKQKTKSSLWSPTSFKH